MGKTAVNATVLTEFERMVEQIMTQWRVPREKAEAAARRELGIHPRSAMEALRDDALIAQLEDDVVAEGDRIMQSLGFVPIRLSQKRRSKVTAGVPDRHYIHPRRKLAVWWEAKATRGQARPEQRQFLELCQQAGVNHVLGGLDELRAWLTLQRVAEFDELLQPHPIPFTTEN